MKRAFLLGLGVGWMTIVACSGADPTGLLADGGGGGGSDGGNGLDVTPPTRDAAPPLDVSVPDVADVLTVDVPVGPPDSRIQCGNVLTCDAKTQICCHHAAATVAAYQCVSSLNDCIATGDVPIACSSDDNCVSQGMSGYTCCALANGAGAGTCNGYTVATEVSCQLDCTQQYDVPVGCDTQLQNCADPQQACITSKCTLPGYTICN